MAGQTDYYNAQAASLAAQVAQAAAQLEFQRQRFQQLELPQFQEMTALQKDQLAFQKATEAWQEAFREASLTGTYQGQPITEWLIAQAQLTGQFQGQPTLAGQQQAYQQALGIANLTGQLPGSVGDILNGTSTGMQGGQTLPYLQYLLQQAQTTGSYQQPGTLSSWEQDRYQQLLDRRALFGSDAAWTAVDGQAPLDELRAFRDKMAGTTVQTPEYQQMLANITGQFNGQQTLAAQLGLGQLGVSQGQLELNRELGESGLSGYLNGAPTLAREQMDASQANQLLSLAAQLRGPRNAFQMATVLGQTPGGLADMLNAMAGRYNLPTYAGGGAAPQAVSLQNFVADTQAQARGLPTFTPPQTSWQQSGPAYQVNPPGTQAPTGAWQYQPTGDGSTHVYPPGITAPQQAGQITSGTPLTATDLHQIGTQQLAAQPYALPLPSQWNAQAWNDANPYLKDLVLADYEHVGWDPDAAEAQFKASLPNSGGPTAGKFAIPGL